LFVQNLAPGFLEDTYHINPTQSGWYVSIISIVSIVASPILGLTLDRWGYRVYLIQVGLVCMLLGFALLMVPQVTTPIPSLMLLGLSFSIIPAALWPCLVILVPAHMFGTAYGIMEAMINAGNVAMYYGIASLLEEKDYFTSMMIFLALTTAGFLLSVVWLGLDQKSGSWCNLPTAVQVRLNKDEVPIAPAVAPSGNAPTSVTVAKQRDRQYLGKKPFAATHSEAEAVMSIQDAGFH
jgi:MFS family permease